MWIREVNGTAGLSQSSRVVHFGLGRAEGVDSLWVHWPSGRMERFVDVPTNARLALVEEEAITEVSELQGSVPVAFGLEANFPNPI